MSRVTGPGRLKSFWENCLTRFLRIDYVFGAVVIIAPLSKDIDIWIMLLKYGHSKR